MSCIVPVNIYSVPFLFQDDMQMFFIGFVFKIAHKKLASAVGFNENNFR